MASEITPQFLFDTIDDHLSARDDLWHVVNGPKRETWFNAETIAALSRRSSRLLSAGFRVYGEEPHCSLAAILKEFGQTASVTGSEDWRKIPDISVLEHCCNDEPVLLTIIEAKLISPSSVKQVNDIELASNLDAQIKTLGNTAKRDGLRDQLDRAALLWPTAQILGLVFAVHRLGQCEQVNPSYFFRDLARRVTGLFAGTAWSLWDGEIKAFAALRDVKPLGGMFAGQASFGLGILAASSMASPSAPSVQAKEPNDGN